MDKHTCPLCNSGIGKFCHGFNSELKKDAFTYLPRKGGNYKKYKIHKTLKRKHSSKKKHRKITNKNRKNKRTRYRKKN